MALLQVLKIPDPRLKVKSKPVEKVDGSVLRLMDDMLETMYANDGVGLAAIQVGIPQRIMVIETSSTELKQPMKFVNPEILWRSDDTESMAEGCLSVPEQYADINRALRLKIRYQDESDTVIEREASGFLAHAFQHELDHLNGVLFIDHLSSLKRSMIMRKTAKAARALTL